MRRFLEMIKSKQNWMPLVGIVWMPLLGIVFLLAAWAWSWIATTLTLAGVGIICYCFRYWIATYGAVYLKLEMQVEDRHADKPSAPPAAS